MREPPSVQMLGDRTPIDRGLRTVSVVAVTVIPFSVAIVIAYYLAPFAVYTRTITDISCRLAGRISVKASLHDIVFRDDHREFLGAHWRLKKSCKYCYCITITLKVTKILREGIDYV